MKKAFKAKFALPSEDDITASNKNLNLDVDEESTWENLDDDNEKSF